MTVLSLPDVTNAPNLRLEMPSSSSFRTPVLIAVGGALVFFTLLLAGPAAAQVSQRGGGEATTPQEQRFERGRSGSVQPSTNLPDWAKPSNSREPSASKNDVETMGTPPPPPSNPPQIPVDGGLALLAAAGAGYAVRKLKGGDDDPMA
jgi:hypothetical protein